MNIIEIRKRAKRYREAFHRDADLLDAFADVMEAAKKDGIPCQDKDCGFEQCKVIARIEAMHYEE